MFGEDFVLEKCVCEIACVKSHGFTTAVCIYARPCCTFSSYKIHQNFEPMFLAYFIDFLLWDNYSLFSSRSEWVNWGALESTIITLSNGHAETIRWNVHVVLVDNVHFAHIFF